MSKKIKYEIYKENGDRLEYHAGEFNPIVPLNIGDIFSLEYWILGKVDAKFTHLQVVKRFVSDCDIYLIVKEDKTFYQIF